MTDRHRGMRILSLEDEPQTLDGPLAVLEFDGHRVTRVENVEQAQACLRKDAFDLLIVDQRVPRDGRLQDEGGSALVYELKRGELGELNRRAAFLFVTGSRAWVGEEGVAALEGFMGIELKGGDLSRQLRERLSRLGTPAHPGSDT